MKENDLISRQSIEWHNYLVADGNGMYHDEKVAYKSEVDALPSAQPDLDEWCYDCKEYDSERHSCPRWIRVIRNAVEAQPEVIHCRDCKHYSTLECMVHSAFYLLRDYDFCSLGERRAE